MKVSEVIAEVRVLIQDTVTPYRYSDADMLGFVNKTVRRISQIRPDLFSVNDFVPTQPNVVYQTLPEEAARLIEIYYVRDGRAITEVHRETLDQTNPAWVSEAAGSPVNWVRHPRTPTGFFLYPRPAENVVLFAEYVLSPKTYRLTDYIECLPDTYQPIVVDGTIFYAESSDNEHVMSGRAEAAYRRMVDALGINQQQRLITDDENAGLGR